MTRHIAIISSSVRTGRDSHSVALYFKSFIESNNIGTAEILDLNEYQFPIFNERLKNMKNPLPAAVDFAQRVTKADGIIIVTPEYNGGYPASIKNAIDLLYDEWHRKPMAISTVSDGVFGGTQVITSLQWSLWKIRAFIATAMFPVPSVDKSFDENGKPLMDGIDKRAKLFIDELLWFIEARKRMREE